MIAYSPAELRKGSFMDSFRAKLHLRGGVNDQNWIIETQAKRKKFNIEQLHFLGLGYELEMEIEIYKDGTNKVISIMGVDVSDKIISI